jgi:translocation and assembly module TamA
LNLPFVLRRIPAPLLILALSLTAAPCAAAFDWWPFGREDAAAAIPDPLPYKATLTLTGADSRLEKALRKASGLIDNEDQPPSDPPAHRARQAGHRAATAAYENVGPARVAIIEGSCRPSACSMRSARSRCRWRRHAGPPFVFEAGGQAAAPRRYVEKLGLATAAPAGSAQIVSAEAAIADGWRKEGHPLVTVQPREVVADHATSKLDVTLHVAAGPVANLGRVSVSGTERVEASLPLRRAGLGGGLYSPQKIKRAETRLRDLGVFDSVRVQTAERSMPMAYPDRDHRVRTQDARGGTVSY